MPAQQDPTRPVGAAVGSGSDVTSEAVVVLSKSFPARPRSFPEIETFVRESLTDAPLSDESQREIIRSVLDALLGAAGPEGSGIHVGFRIYQDSVEVDVLRTALPGDEAILAEPPPQSFAEWMRAVLGQRELTQEAAARQLGVSVRTVSRWISGTTEPRLRDVRRIREIFGAPPPLR